MRAVDETLRAGFADELLARLARSASRRDRSPLVKGAIAGATVAASVVLLVTSRRRSR